jgi:hypothetical protein
MAWWTDGDFPSESNNNYTTLLQVKINFFRVNTFENENWESPVLWGSTLNNLTAAISRQTSYWIPFRMQQVFIIHETHDFSRHLDGM